MKINKKGIGTASTFLISSLIAVSLIIIVGMMVNDLSDAYSVTNIDYFDGYDNISGDVGDVSGAFVSDYDTSINDSLPETDTTEDVMFIKAFKIVGKLGGLTKTTSAMVREESADLGIAEEFILLAITIAGIVLITLIIKIIRGYDNV